MSLSSSQTTLLMLIKAKIKQLKTLVYGHGLNEDQLSNILKNIIMRCCPKAYAEDCKKDKNFINIIQKLSHRKKEPQAMLISILTEIDCQRACFQEDKESSSEVKEIKRIKPAKKRLLDEGYKAVKMEQISSEQREWQSKLRSKREDCMMRKKIKSELLERLKKKKREEIF